MTDILSGARTSEATHLPPYPEASWPWRSYRPAKGLAAAALTLAGVWTLVEVVEAIAVWSAADTYAQAARNQVPVDDIVTVYDIVGIGWLLAALASYVVGCLLLWRLRKNAEALVRYPHTRADGWVWAGWLVPLVALWFPYQVVRDIRAATEPPGARHLVGWWWAAWLLTTITTVVGASLVPVTGQTSEESAQALGPVETLDAVLVAVAFALWCGVVLRILAEQDRRAADSR